MDFIDAREIEAALGHLAERGDETTVLAGGTDVVVALHANQLTASTLLHVRRLSDLHGIVAHGRTQVGAATTHGALATDPHIRAEHPAVVEAALTVGGRQTQNIGTIGGNVVNASP